MNTLGNRIKHRRETLNFSRAYLADQMDVTEALIRHYENDTRKPSIERLCALADTLNISIDWLVNHEVERAQQLELA